MEEVCSQQQGKAALRGCPDSTAGKAWMHRPYMSIKLWKDVRHLITVFQMLYVVWSHTESFLSSYSPQSNLGYHDTVLSGDEKAQSLSPTISHLKEFLCRICEEERQETT